MNGTQTEPADTVESEIAALMAEQENDDDRATTVDEGEEAAADDDEGSGEDQQRKGDEEDAAGTEEADDGNNADDDQERDTDDSEDGEEAKEAEDDLGASADEGTVLDPPEHWAAEHKELFKNQTPEAQEFLLERHKAMEGDYTRKSQEVADVRRQYDTIRDALAPYEQDFARSGLDHAGAVRQLAHWHSALKTGGRAAVEELARTYGIDMTVEDSREPADPALQPILNELHGLKQTMTEQQKQAQLEHQAQLEAEVAAFESAKDEQGKLLHPHLKILEEDMSIFLESRRASGLQDAYDKALLLHPELSHRNDPKDDPKPDIKADQAEKVRKAKKAATGVRSSGAVGKKKRDMSLEEEIAAQIG